MNTFVSEDGTKIGYVVTGGGPALILVQGAMGTAHIYRDLARARSSDFTVYTPDRRGRGMSPKAIHAKSCQALLISEVSDLAVQGGRRAEVPALSRSSGVVAPTPDVPMEPAKCRFGLDVLLLG